MSRDEFADSKNIAENKTGLLDSLPWRDRWRIQTKALWDVCPNEVQGTVAWALLSPWIVVALMMLRRLDPAGGFILKWGRWDQVLFLVLPALILSLVFLPAIRGLAALRAGGLWAEYLAATNGVDANGNKVKVVFGHWAVFAWLWFMAVFGSWLIERSMRLDGLTLGNSVWWHIFNTARIEVCLLIVATAVAAGLSKAGVFASRIRAGVSQQGGPEALEQTQSGTIKADWSKLGKGLKSGLAVGGSLVLNWVKAEWLRWREASASGAWWGASWLSWWSPAPFPVRAVSMSACAFGLWWLFGQAMARVIEQAWVADALVAKTITWPQGLAVIALSSLLARLSSKRVGEPWGSGLWFGPAGPSMAAWVVFAAAGAVFDAGVAVRAAMAKVCSESGLAGGGLLIAVAAWAAVVWGGDLMIWLGGHIESVIKQAREAGGWRGWAIVKVVLKRLEKSWSVAGAAKESLTRAMEKKVLENEVDLAKSLRKELEELVPVVVKRGRGASRL